MGNLSEAKNISYRCVASGGNGGIFPSSTFPFNLIVGEFGYFFVHIFFCTIAHIFGLEYPSPLYLLLYVKIFKG